MEIHNTNEDTVKQIIEDYCSNENFDKDKYCSCIQCRLDVACYVLNNSKPRYTVSSRGIIHHEMDYISKLQETADLYHLVKDGFEIIASHKRPGVDHSIDSPEKVKPGLYFNFPNIIGKVLDGKTFEPIRNAEIILYLDEKIVSMTSKTTPNPNITESATKSIFVFQPAPVIAEKVGITKTFRFQIVARKPDYQEYISIIDISSTSENSYADSMHVSKTMNLDDIYLFPVVE